MSYSRILAFKRSWMALGAIALAAAATTLRQAEAVPSYDGLWSVVIMTKAGLCEPSYRYPVRITNGHLINAGKASVQISGHVAKNGSVVVNVSSGDKTAIGTGHLAASTGAGSWTGGICAGTWQAERRG
jgi:hypothetical protein